MKMIVSDDIKRHLRVFLILYIAGFLLGILGTNLLHNQFEYPSSLLGIYFMSQEQPKFENSRYFYQLLESRGVWYLFYGIGGITFLGVPLVLGGLIWLGFLAGSLMTMFLVEYGVRGLLMGTACFLPQCFFYIPATLGFFLIVYRMSMRFWRRQQIGKERYRSYLFFLAGIVIVYLCGIFMESYLNYNVLSYVKSLV